MTAQALARWCWRLARALASGVWVGVWIGVQVAVREGARAAVERWTGVPRALPAVPRAAVPPPVARPAVPVPMAPRPLPPRREAPVVKARDGGGAVDWRKPVAPGPTRDLSRIIGGLKQLGCSPAQAAAAAEKADKRKPGANEGDLMRAALATLTERTTT